ncbi:serine hydrolase FSH [Durotheca rogersii]|uniref:serine hydrolase FSH n=1 Tax=Durotheca rogersii TaxID=419775 RepID=UPI002220EAC0|nr:serine hydrolase FSH [Durotheca rogersii]KAI5863728.1 serine hydrolase FSH [Durotheca rogersii]
MTTPSPSSTLHLPRMLCLHGGGTNARIFQMQCRVLSRALEPYFRLVYAEAPYASTAGPDVLSVYADYGPFKRWLRWLPEHPEVDDAAAIADIDRALRAAMDADDRAGARGPWLGLLGFSQGAKLAASLLFRQQARAAQLGPARAGSDWRFAVVIAGRAPIVSLDLDVCRSALLSRPSQITVPPAAGEPGGPDLMELASGSHVLRLPTIHVHGLRDPGHALHRELFEDYCDPTTARLIEWDGDHRIPLKTSDVQPLIDDILDVARATGALKF